MENTTAYPDREMVKKFMDHAGTICPYCNHPDMTRLGKIDDPHGGEVFVRFECVGCHARWKSCYRISGVFPEMVERN